MSLISNLKAWLFGTTNDTSGIATASTTQPCRYLLDNSTSNTFVLPDGRKLGYAQYGSPTGKTILYNHGFPGSRLEASQHHDICLGLGLRMIAIDRPGHGWSSPHPGAKLLDWSKDVERLAEHLGLESYSVMGVSGGGASALACAFALPAQKLKCVSVVCGMGPPDIGMRGADLPHLIGWPYGIRNAPYWLGRWFWRTQAIGRLDLTEQQRLELMIEEGKKAPESDRDIYADVDFLRLAIRACGEAFAQGYDYVWDDGALNCSDFDFKLQDIREDLTVQLWYGKYDYFVPLNHGLQIAARLGGRAQLRVEDEAHAGILMHWKKEIFEAIAKGM
ncbi:alpha/beta-hydrolase [Ophiobolus disseminans]|uniref:Alpha/beta-hydrolase n=1 Tax=Ophiobolus disseminans TaxID=1469910 RepID=A0A6A7AD65_9PLEO|nr:alpha/beta-hydrolase [Ophiobolus disseminans]